MTHKRFKREPLPSGAVVFPAHGEPVTITRHAAGLDDKVSVSGTIQVKPLKQSPNLKIVEE